jgi:hypothetical protein
MCTRTDLVSCGAQSFLDHASCIAELGYKLDGGQIAKAVRVEALVRPQPGGFGLPSDTFVSPSPPPSPTGHGFTFLDPSTCPDLRGFRLPSDTFVMLSATAPIKPSTISYTPPPFALTFCTSICISPAFLSQECCGRELQPRT